VAPILHLSLPVRDLDEARAFYVEVLGCAPGRVRDGWADVWFYPSGNAIELKSYADPAAALSP
jgi:extradiol dioxygenase family protein